MSLTFYNRETLKKHTHWRWGEEKLGSAVAVADSWEQLAESSARYALVGIPEDIGVRANYGVPGAAKAWNACLDALCNIQHNTFTQADTLLILGEIDCKEEMQDTQQLEVDDPFFPTKIGSLVKAVDDKVAEVIQKIVLCNKIPIVIGGGHNNAYGNIKGTSQAYNRAIHCINLDAHTDFRALEHRHSGNGFTYAKEDGFLDRYYMLGIHRNYTSQSVFDEIEKIKDQVKFSLFEELFFSEKHGLEQALAQGKKHIKGGPFGVELDMDAIVAMGSSAISPEGFSLQEARKYLRYYTQLKDCAYIHICEGNPLREIHPNQVGKSLAYLVSDIISK